MKKIAKEFREFISRGNVMDMAVGVIVGGAFGKITSLHSMSDCQKCTSIEMCYF